MTLSTAHPLPACFLRPLCSIKQRAEVIQHVLLDKESTVAEAGAELLAHWLQQDCQGDPLKILQLLDVETYTGKDVACSQRCQHDLHEKELCSPSVVAELGLILATRLRMLSSCA